MIAAALALALGAAAPAAEVDQVPEILKSVEIVEHLGDQVPLDATFRDQQGRTVSPCRSPFPVLYGTPAFWGST